MPAARPCRCRYFIASDAMPKVKLLSSRSQRFHRGRRQLEHARAASGRRRCWSHQAGIYGEQQREQHRVAHQEHPEAEHHPAPRLDGSLRRLPPQVQARMDVLAHAATSRQAAVARIAFDFARRPGVAAADAACQPVALRSALDLRWPDASGVRGTKLRAIDGADHAEQRQALPATRCARPAPNGGGQRQRADATGRSRCSPACRWLRSGPARQYASPDCFIAQNASRPLDLGRAREVVLRRRRGGSPLQAAAVPGIADGDPSCVAVTDAHRQLQHQRREARARSAPRRPAATQQPGPEGRRRTPRRSAAACPPGPAHTAA